MRTVWSRLQRIELGFELGLMGVTLELFHRGIRPGLDVGCGSAISQLSDDFLGLTSEYHLTATVPIMVALVELRVAFRSWVKRSVRLGSGALIALLLLSYAISVWAFVR